MPYPYRTDLRNSLLFSQVWCVHVQYSMWRNPKQNVTYKLVFDSSAVPSMSCQSYLRGMCDGGGVSGRTTVSEICLKQHVVLLCRSHRALCRSHRRSHLTFYSKRFVRVHLMQPCSCNDMASAYKNNHFILLERSHIHDCPLVKSKCRLPNLYFHIDLSWWDIAADVWDLVF